MRASKFIYLACTTVLLAALSQQEVLANEQTGSSIDGQVQTNSETLTQAQAPTTGQISFENKDDTAGTVDITITNASNANGIKEVKVPVWSETSGQDDIIWYTADKTADSAYKVNLDIANHHNNTGTYHAHLYYVQNDGSLIGAGASSTEIKPPQETPAQPTGTVTIANQNDAQGTFDVVVTNVSAPAGVREIKVPIWSEAGGQDDLVWYRANKQSDGSFLVKVNIKDHKNTRGLYHAHLYLEQNNGSQVGLGGTTTEVKSTTPAAPSATISISNKNDAQGTFDVVVSKVVAPLGVSEIKVPVWSETGGQDDLVWYTAQKQSDGTYLAKVKSSDHKNSKGLYHAHLYMVQGNGAQVGLGATSTELKPVTSATPSATISIANKNDAQGTFDVVVSKVVAPSGVSEIKVPVWSETGGQDDLVWYTAQKQADGTYLTKVQKSNHNNSTGTYHAHLYMVQGNGVQVGLGGTSTELKIPAPTQTTGTISITNKNDAQGSFDVVVTNVANPGGVKEVVLPIWSEAGGQDDIVWYIAKKQSDGSYVTNVKASAHGLSTGVYNIHLYYRQNDNSLTGVGGTTTSLAQPTTAGQISVKEQGAGKVLVTIANVANPQSIKTVLVPSWTEAGGQDDLTWYTAQKQADGTYQLLVDLANHRDQSKGMHFHLYYQLNDGSMQAIGGTSGHFAEPVRKGVQHNGSYYYVQGKYEQIPVINKKYALSSNYNPGENPTAQAEFNRLKNDMIAQGFPVGQAYSGFRSYSNQANLYQNYVNRDGQANADRYSARAGHSEHQTGLAFDLTNQAGNLLEDAGASRWLRENAHKYGFIVRYLPGKEHITGYMPEPWHIRYVGKEAGDIYASGLTLEEYFGFAGGGYDNPASSSTTAPGIQGTTPAPGRTNLPPTGSYTFKARAAIKAEPTNASPLIVHYEAGETVRYDKIVESDGRLWLSYITYTGARRYVELN